MDRNELVQITRRRDVSNAEFADFQNSLFEEIWGKLFPPQIVSDGLSNTVSGNIITQENESIPDCMSCGACCAAFVLVDVEESNIVDQSLWYVSSAEDGSPKRYLRRRESDFACTALEGTVGDRVSCGIYDERPGMCRKFEAGSDRCHAVRRAYGIEPFLTLEEMSEAKRKLDEFESSNKPT